jgi:uncharacterized protein (DUF2147 family)
MVLGGINAQAQYAFLGQWYNEEKTSKLQIYEQDGKFFGKIIWLEVLTNSDGTTPRRDEYNPNPDLQHRQLQNLVILENLVWDAEDKEWQNGLIYDPEVGKTYECYCKMQPDGTLYFKGYILGITWLGRSTTWTRK